MNPTQPMIEDVKLSRIITDDDQALGDAVMEHTSKKGTLCGYLDMSMIDNSQPL